MNKVRLCLQEIAKSKGLTLSDIQRNTGLTMGMVRRYWYNNTSSVKLEALEVIADYLDIKPSDLITDEEDNQTS